MGVGKRVEIWAEEKWNEYSLGKNKKKELEELKNYGV